MCDWGVGQPWRWGADTGNSWRIDMDIAADWDAVLRSLASAIGLGRFAGPGGWNDPDMLEVRVAAGAWTGAVGYYPLQCHLRRPLLP
jgi:alpha-galactosidase